MIIIQFSYMEILGQSFFSKKNLVIFPYHTVLFGTDSRRNYIESFFNGFLKLYDNCKKIVWIFND